MVTVPPIVGPVLIFARLVLYVLDNVPAARGIGISSWLRSDVRSVELADAGRGVGLRSLHNQGLAMDLVGAPGVLGAFGEAWQVIGLDAVFEPDHLHIEFDGPLLRRFGLDFRVPA